MTEEERAFCILAGWEECQWCKLYGQEPLHHPDDIRLLGGIRLCTSCQVANWHSSTCGRCKATLEGR